MKKSSKNVIIILLSLVVLFSAYSYYNSSPLTIVGLSNINFYDSGSLVGDKVVNSYWVLSVIADTNEDFDLIKGQTFKTDTYFGILGTPKTQSKITVNIEPKYERYVLNNVRMSNSEQIVSETGFGTKKTSPLIYYYSDGVSWNNDLLYTIKVYKDGTLISTDDFKLKSVGDSIKTKDGIEVSTLGITLKITNPPTKTDYSYFFVDGKYRVLDINDVSDFVYIWNKFFDTTGYTVPQGKFTNENYWLNDFYIQTLGFGSTFYLPDMSSNNYCINIMSSSSACRDARHYLTEEGTFVFDDIFYGKIYYPADFKANVRIKVPTELADTIIVREAKGEPVITSLTLSDIVNSGSNQLIGVKILNKGTTDNIGISLLDVNGGVVESKSKMMNSNEEQSFMFTIPFGDISENEKQYKYKIEVTAQGNAGYKVYKDIVFTVRSTSNLGKGTLEVKSIDIDNNEVKSTIKMDGDIISSTGTFKGDVYEGTHIISGSDYENLFTTSESVNIVKGETKNVVLRYKSKDDKGDCDLLCQLKDLGAIFWILGLTIFTVIFSFIDKVRTKSKYLSNSNIKNGVITSTAVLSVYWLYLQYLIITTALGAWLWIAVLLSILVCIYLFTILPMFFKNRKLLIIIGIIVFVIIVNIIMMLKGAVCSTPLAFLMGSGCEQKDVWDILFGGK